MIVKEALERIKTLTSANLLELLNNMLSAMKTTDTMQATIILEYVTEINPDMKNQYIPTIAITLIKVDG